MHKHAYGHTIDQNDVLPEDAVKHVLQDHARLVLKHLGTPEAMDRVVYRFNMPFEYYDEASGKFIRGFQSWWRVSDLFTR